MAGVLIYSSALNLHYSLVAMDNEAYSAHKEEILANKSNRILWERANVNINQIEDSRKTRAILVKKLNKGKQVDLEKKLSGFFNLNSEISG